MGGVAICFGLFVILVVVLGTENDVNAAPLPNPDICIYRQRHQKAIANAAAAATAAAAAENKAKEADKFGRLEKLLKIFYAQEEEAEKSEAEKQKKKETKKVEEPVGFVSVNEFWSSYMALITKLMQSF